MTCPSNSPFFAPRQSAMNSTNSATTEIHRRLTSAFDAFHRLLSGGSGTDPPIRYVADPPELENPLEIEVRIVGIRFCIEADFGAGFILLVAIDFQRGT